jgi:maltokinase
VIVDADAVAPLISEWLPTQRWFAGKGRPIESITPSLLAALHEGSPEVTIWTAEVRYLDGTSETYQVPLSARDAPAESLGHVLLGTIDSPARSTALSLDLPGDPSAAASADLAAPTDEPYWIYDALHDKEATQYWLEGVRDQSVLGVLRFENFSDSVELPIGEPSLVLTAEQSNTSLIYSDKAILKVFRRLEPGLNPDIEVHAALTKLGGRHIAPLFGAVSATSLIDPDVTISLGMLQEFMTTATDGWELAKISVRDLMAEGDLHAAEAGGDFAGEAERLGIATAELHEDLAAAFGTSDLSTEQRRERATQMHRRLDQALNIVPVLAEVEDGLRATFEAFAAYDGPIPTQRVHGDLHLGQALRTAKRWIVLDFEGEPAATIAERRQFDSPLRDVAGMLRSFDYVARHQIIGQPAAPQLLYRASEWSQRNRDAFRAGYSATTTLDVDAAAVLARAFEADKAVYEAMYEARNRPSWLAIPLASLSRLGSSGPTAQEGTS